MHHRHFVFALVGILLACAASRLSARGDEAAKPAPIKDATFVNLRGKTWRPADDPSTKAIALVFVLADCPIANSYLPELNRLHASLSPRGVLFILVHADSAITASEAAEHARQYKIEPPVVLDPKHRWVKLAKASVSPEAVVFSPAGEVLYHGRINDQYVALGKRRGAVTSHDLRDALEAIVAGRAVTVANTEAVGCLIPPPSNGQ